MPEADHTLVVYFDDEKPYVGLKCNLSGADRPCAGIDCRVDHEDASRECIEAHGATVLDKCWAVEYFEASGWEGLNHESLRPVEIPVRVFYDDGVVVENVESEDA